MKFSSAYHSGRLSPEAATSRISARFYSIIAKQYPDISILKYISGENLRTDDFIVNKSPENRVVGIKFDNISARIYNVIEHTTQRRVFGKKMMFLSYQAATLQKDDFLVRALECNEPAVLCQSTFH
jgi:hypothetical protein